MDNPINYLIGQGETLSQPLSLKSGGDGKKHPYTFDEAFKRLAPEMDQVAYEVSTLPDLACPNDQTVISITLHPTYLAKSYYPTKLLKAVGLRQVGSRETKIMPSAWTQKTAPDKPMVAPELFIAGDKNKIIRLKEEIQESQSSHIQDDFRKIEHIAALDLTRLRPIPGDEDIVPLEVVLHADVTEDEGEKILLGFKNWCKSLGITTEWAQRQQVGGLSFLGLRVKRSLIPDMTRFSFLRAVRRMPTLTFRDVDLRVASTASSFQVILPDEGVADPELKAAIFDGGLDTTHSFPSYVTARDVPGLGNPTAQGLKHGGMVTSAFLYGPLTKGETPSNPYASVDHWRILDDQGDDFQLMKTLDRIMDVLEQHPYDLVNLSIGPDEALIDDDVHVWTARLDQYAASGRTLIISAAGNNGEMDEATGLCRVQPASDGVNVLAVGAADSIGTNWKRAAYSAKGPGRSPGLVKPDVLAFGGSDQEPFFALDGSDTAYGVTGTSFSAPAVSRLGLGLKALFGAQLSPVAVKALLVHRANAADLPQTEVGWGRLPSDLGNLSTCKDDEATIVYQGMLEPARYRRFFIPVPMDGFSGKVTLSATFVTATAIDPEDTINYTRTGVGITFRPKSVGHPGYTTIDGERRQRVVHKSVPFFGNSNVFQTEQQLRDDAHRWEAVRKRTNRNFQAGTLDQPVFDIEHLARAHGQTAARSEAVNYALIVTVQEKGSTDLYNRIIRSYAGRLQAMRPQVEIPVRARSA